MRVVKIGAVWCNGCLVMNNVWNKVLKVKDIDCKSLDIDMDEEEVKDYNVGDTLPVFIFYKDNKEIKRVIGEKSYDEMIATMKDVLIHGGSSKDGQKHIMACEKIRKTTLLKCDGKASERLVNELIK